MTMDGTGRVSPEWPAAVSSRDSEEEQAEWQLRSEHDSVGFSSRGYKAERLDQSRVPSVHRIEVVVRPSTPREDRHGHAVPGRPAIRGAEDAVDVVSACDIEGVAVSSVRESHLQDSRGMVCHRPGEAAV